MTWWSFLKKGFLATRSLVVLLLASVPTGSAGAADWSLKALFSETATYDDNRGLSAISPGDTYGLLSALTLDLGARTATCQFDFTANLNYPFHFGPGAAGLTDRFDTGFATSFTKKLSELTTIKLSASLNPESTTTSELTDSGDITLNATRLTTTFGGSIEHKVTPLDTLTLSAMRTMVSFTGASGTLVPFTSTDVSGSWRHLVSRRTTLTATLGFSEYDPDSMTTPSSKTYSGTLGANLKLTKRLTASVSGGLRATASAGGGTKLGYLASANLSYKKKRGDVLVSFSESASPSSLGGIQNSLSFGLNAGYAINDHARAAISASYSNFTSPTDTSRQLLQISPSYTYELTRTSRAALSYTFIRQWSGAAPTSSNQVMLRYSHDFDILH